MTSLGQVNTVYTVSIRSLPSCLVYTSRDHGNGQSPLYSLLFKSN